MLYIIQNFFSPDSYSSMKECMQTCQNLQQSRAPNLENVEVMRIFLQKMANVFFLPGTSNVYPGVVARPSIWLAITDAETEGKWLDWYNGKEIDLSEAAVNDIGVFCEKQRNN